MRGISRPLKQYFGHYFFFAADAYLFPPKFLVWQISFTAVKALIRYILVF